MKYRVSTKSHHEYNDKIPLCYETEAPTSEARFAFELVGRFGLIAADDGGEDTAGRAKGRLLSPQEVVARAFDISVAAHAEARQRGLMLALPDINEINAKADAEEKRAKEKV